MGLGEILLVAAATVTRLLMVLPEAGAEAPPASTTSGQNATLCQQECGGLKIPYPFGIGKDCSLPGFEVHCTGTELYYSKPHDRNMVFIMLIFDISIPKAQVRIRTWTSLICSSGYAPPNWFLDLRGTPFTISDKENKFTSIVCNTMALIRGTLSNTYTTGCISICPDGNRSELVADGHCDGIGCCETPVPFGLKYYQIAIREVSIAVDNMTTSTNSCGFAFHYYNIMIFQRPEPLKKEKIIVEKVVLDWSIGNQTCEEAQKNATRYACKSTNSICNKSNTGEGYICNCNPGYQGNPYVLDGCQDIDECKDNRTYPCRGVCSNLIGSYNCSCPLGTEGNATTDGCRPLPIIITRESSKSKATIGIAIGVGSTLLALLLLGSCIVFYKRSQKQNLEKERQKHYQNNYDLLMQQQQQLCFNLNENVADKVKFYSLRELEKATNNFDSTRVVGHGGHGTVYKGLIDLRVVAIKKSNVAIQIEVEQFLNEIILLSQISHRNVVKLIGCCLEDEVPLLVYEFISNGNLSDRLDVWHRDSSLIWGDRLRIATEISRGLSYLHSAANVSIFHRDIKSSNILLDENLTAKISDFGASRTITFDQTHISTNVQGTFGYLDPEYMHTGQLTEKTDVYSLGVILVELLTGEKPTSKSRSQDDKNLISRFMLAINDNRLFEVVEASITKVEHREEIEIVAKLAMSCLSFKGDERPTIKDVEVTLDRLMKEKDKNKKKITEFPNHEEIQSLSYATSSLQRSGSATMTGSATSLEGPAIPSQTLFR